MRRKGSKSRLDHPSTAEPADAGRSLASTVFVLVAAGRRLQRLLAKLAASAGLSETQLVILAAIGDESSPEWSQVAIARRTGFSPAQVSGTVEELRRRGFLSGVRRERDRRHQAWSLTPPGRATLAVVLGKMPTHDLAFDAAETLAEIESELAHAALDESNAATSLPRLSGAA